MTTEEDLKALKAALLAPNGAPLLAPSAGFPLKVESLEVKLRSATYRMDNTDLSPARLAML